MQDDIKNIFHFIIVFQCLLFSFYIISQGKKQKSSQLLVLFFLVIAVNQVSGIILQFKDLKYLVIDKAPFIFNITYPFYFAHIPLLYLYMQSLTKEDFHLKKVHLFHFIPFIVFSLITIIWLIANDSPSLKENIKNYVHFSEVQDRIYSILQNIQFFSYMAASIVLLRDYRIRIKNIFSTINKINLSWLSFVIYGFIAWKAIHLLEITLWLTTGYQFLNLLMFLYIFAELSFIVFISLMFIKRINQPTKSFGADNSFKKKYEKTSLSQSVIEDHKRKLLSYMDTNKPFLNPLLTLPELAEQIRIPHYHLSQILNNHFNKNFYDLINSYRIEESKRLLLENGKSKTILEILYASGFNSKSVFNTAFKKHTGKTPSQFRNDKETLPLPHSGPVSGKGIEKLK